MRPGPAKDPYRHHRLLTTLLLVGLTVPWFSAFYEWEHYAHGTLLLARKPWGWAELPLVWVFYAKTQLFVLPLTAVAAVAVARGWWRTGWLAWCGGLVAVFLWVELEKTVYPRTGVHVHEYVKFLRGPDAAQWAGQLDVVRYVVRLGLESTLKLSLIPLAVGVVGASVLWRRSPGRLGPAALRVLAVCLVVSCAGVVPAQWAYRDRAALRQVHALLPLNFRWSAPLVKLADTNRFAGPLNAYLRDAGVDASARLMHAGAPADDGATFAGGRRPNVIFVVVESLRADALTPEVMPRLSRLRARGLTLTRHSSGGKWSQYGLYNLLYARPALSYFGTLLGSAPPQACASFRGSGYEAHYVGSADHRGWMGMDLMVNERTFDRVELNLGASWPHRDHRTLKEVRRLATEAGGRPRFVTAFLTSTHYPYAYHGDFARRAPVSGPDWDTLAVVPADRPALLNRYHNACEFLDHEVGKLVESIDLTRNVVVITGDHGESFFEDDVYGHGGRWSDVQWSVPCILLGPGIPAGERATRTFHQDVLPTVLHAAAGRTVPIRHTTGRDLLLGDVPAPEFEVLGSEATGEFAEFVLARRGGAERVVMHVLRNRPGVLVQGTVDPSGKIDRLRVPPAADVPAWGGALVELLRVLGTADPRP